MEDNNSLYHTFLGAAVASTFAAAGLVLGHHQLEVGLRNAEFSNDLRNLIFFCWDALYFTGGATIGTLIAYELMPREK